MEYQQGQGSNDGEVVSGVVRIGPLGRSPPSLLRLVLRCAHHVRVVPTEPVRPVRPVRPARLARLCGAVRRGAVRCGAARCGAVRRRSDGAGADASDGAADAGGGGAEVALQRAGRGGSVSSGGKSGCGDRWLGGCLCDDFPTAALVAHADLRGRTGLRAWGFCKVGGEVFHRKADVIPLHLG